MRARTLVASAGVAGLLGTGAFLLPAVASTNAPARPGCGCRVVTLKFISVTKDARQLSASTAAQQDTDVSAAGKFVGFDDLYLVFNAKTGAGAGNFAFDTRGGFIFGTLRVSGGSGATGRITGGTGRYRNVSGSLVARTLNKSGSRTAVTITYRHH
jgi:hypothetical protein